MPPFKLKRHERVTGERHRHACERGAAMKTRAPGKVVLSGAYSVLEGATAIVSAVDRYVVADDAGVAEFRTPEVTLALGATQPPSFDASALRSEGRKLGLGSSAAILVASLGALHARELAPGAADYAPASDAALQHRVLKEALVAHRAAQGGGSGVDVLASTLGGTLAVQRSPAAALAKLRGNRPVQHLDPQDGTAALAFTAVSLPADLVIEVWAADAAASTSSFLKCVQSFKKQDPVRHGALFSSLTSAAEQALTACVEQDATAFLNALGRQRDGLLSLGEAAGVPIVTPAVCELDRDARSSGALVLPAGAGGGDVCLYVGPGPSSASLRAHAQDLGHQVLLLHLGAPGLHVIR